MIPVEEQGIEIYFTRGYFKYTISLICHDKKYPSTARDDRIARENNNRNVTDPLKKEDIVLESI